MTERKFYKFSNMEAKITKILLFTLHFMIPFLINDKVGLNRFYVEKKIYFIQAVRISAEHQCKIQHPRIFKTPTQI